MVNWIDLQEDEQLSALQVQSFTRPQVIFKHSTRCSISLMVKNRLDNSSPVEGMDFYYLDLIRHRNISNRVAEIYHVHHESPQVLLIRNGECIYDESHMGISMDELGAMAGKA